MAEPHTWRELLGRVIKDVQERQRLADALGVTPTTLTRWVKQVSVPHAQNLRKLLIAMPQHRDLLLPLLLQEFGDISTLLQVDLPEDSSDQLSAEFYRRVLRTFASIPAILCFPSLCDFILAHALKELDPHRLGMAIIVARCQPPSEGQKVRTLRGSVGRGTPPWEANLDQQAMLLGAESLTGYAVIVGRMVVRQRLREDGQTLLPAYRGPWEESAVAAPITCEGRMAGSLLVSSTQPDYFLPSRQQLIQQYADAIALAFESEEFYEPERLALGLVPPQEAQRPYLATFSQRLIGMMVRSARDGQPLTLKQAEEVVWQQLENELLQLLLLQKVTEHSTVS